MIKKISKLKNWIIIIIFALFFVLLVINTHWWETALHFLFPSQSNVIYPRLPLFTMVAEHLKLVVLSSSLTVLIGVPLGVLLTRPSMEDFLSITNNLVSIGQTFPPVAVLALAVPVFGFGLVPTVIALFLYGLLPVVRNTIAGLKSVPPYIIDGAYGLGMNRIQALFKIKLPLAARVIIAGIRISVIINIGTAMIGAVIGAGGLGVPVIAGLVQDNIAFILQGVIPAAFLTILVDQFFNNIEKRFIYLEKNI